MMTATIASLLWLAGIVAWYAIRYPFQRRAARMGVARSTGGAGDRTALTIAAIGQFLIPALYVVSGQPAFADAEVDRCIDFRVVELHQHVGAGDAEMGGAERHEGRDVE